MRNRLLSSAIGFLLLQATAAIPQLEPSKELYTTCPDFEHAVIRDVAYIEVSNADLLRWASKRVYPPPQGVPETINVLLEIEGDHAFCAAALNGAKEKQKAAVESALKWRFKKKRGDLKRDITGNLSFRF